jgi:omega-6 fatty acid desaturase (delta-12 desaturase)
MYRHPIVLFGLGPAYLFLIQHRLPVGMMRAGWKPWVSVLGTNLAIVAITAGLIAVFGVAPVLITQLTTLVLAATIGVWLFYVQHQYEGVSWSRSSEWKAIEAAFAGSSHYDLPPVLRWFTGNIGVHHVHHAASKVPFYRLPEVLRDMPQLKDVGRVTLGESFRYAGLALWDERRSRLVSFREAKRIPAET